MKNALFTLLMSIVLTSCVSSDHQIKQTLKENPDLIFDAIKENPEKFIAVVNEAARTAQANEFKNRAAELERQRASDLKNPKRPDLDEKRKLLGNSDSKIVVVEYADFQCPACRMAHAELKKFLEKHKGNVQFYFKNMPLDFHEMAYPAAEYFEAILQIDPNKAYAFYDYVFSHQSQLVESGFLDRAAKATGVDTKKLNAKIKSDLVKEQIVKDRNEFQKFGFTGTPVIILNGLTLSGAQGFEELEKALKLTQK